MPKIINDIHQIYISHPRFTQKVQKISYFDPKLKLNRALVSSNSFYQRKKNGGAEQILLDDQPALNWYD